MAKLWERHYGMLLARMRHRDSVTCIALNPAQPGMAVTAGDDKLIKVLFSVALTATNKDILYTPFVTDPLEKLHRVSARVSLFTSQLIKEESMLQYVLPAQKMGEQWIFSSVIPQSIKQVSHRRLLIIWNFVQINTFHYNKGYARMFFEVTSRSHITIYFSIHLITIVCWLPETGSC